MAIEVCHNCDRTIGRLERAYIHKEHIICSDCKTVLQAKNCQNDQNQKVVYQIVVPPIENVDLKKVQTIEKTGKLYKAGMLIGIVGMIIGIPMACAGCNEWILLIGLILYLVFKIGAWWKHG